MWEVSFLASDIDMSELNLNYFGLNGLDAGEGYQYSNEDYSSFSEFLSGLLFELLSWIN
ncbi:hypothetical protein VCHA50O413_10186 [Vibrio chagasii]|nr:hypothetical protein VCHA32O87_120126 [Vibrio chagasii]CAH6811889.1 hypothetical protein VCHA34P117_120153 [Vibrio chagasii]CAH6874834.1 hypothetical protein VCHA34O109_220076 [Vibrio chagasii]CAH6881768.1 hypothetical protein VCHA36P166_250007 [Vibrio chagasii]CAH6898650.1 hypothetical protein VCHA35P150_20355 [Vibrio chagasii]